nr:unnamed protein product [Callosobruchus analis]
MCGEDQSVTFKHFNSLNKHLLTFSKWPNHVEPTPIAIARFFYTGKGDICQTFCCGNWKKGDCPIKDHLNYTEYCIYAKHINNLLQRMCVREELFSQQLIDKLYSMTSKMFSQQKNPVYKESYSYDMVDNNTQTVYNPIVVLGERKYPLNKSKSKYVTVGVYSA